MKRAVLVGLALALVAGCGDDSNNEMTTAATESSIVKVYFLRDGKLWPVARAVEVDHSRPEQAVMAESAGAALFELRQGPTKTEMDDLGLSTALPSSFADVVVVDRITRFDPGIDFPHDALAQVVYTLTQFPGIHAVEIHGRSYTRADFEDQTPSVLVESPLPFEEVTSPLRVTGTANTFEATFQYELVDAEGNVVDENFVTATSGTGTRGTFAFTTGAFDDVAALRIFENSAEDGSRIHEVEIPLNAAP